MSVILSIKLSMVILSKLLDKVLKQNPGVVLAKSSLI